MEDNARQIIEFVRDLEPDLINTDLLEATEVLNLWLSQEVEMRTDWSCA